MQQKQEKGWLPKLCRSGLFEEGINAIQEVPWRRPQKGKNQIRGIYYTGMAKRQAQAAISKVKSSSRFDSISSVAAFFVWTTFRSTSDLEALGERSVCSVRSPRVRRLGGVHEPPSKQNWLQHHCMRVVHDTAFRLSLETRHELELSCWRAYCRHVVAGQRVKVFIMHLRLWVLGSFKTIGPTKHHAKNDRNEASNRLSSLFNCTNLSCRE